jgi:hypothetical protein
VAEPIVKESGGLAARPTPGVIMNRTTTAVAVSALALGVIGASAGTANAINQYPDSAGVGAINQYPDDVAGGDSPPAVTVQVDDAKSEAVQAGAAALGGAGLAFAGLWLYRRHQLALN